MNARGRETGRIRTVFVSACLIGFVLGGMAGAWSLQGNDAGATHAGLFGPPIIDLGLTAKDGGGPRAFIGGSNLAPDDRSTGTLHLFSRTPLHDGLYDLDFDVRTRIQGLGDQRLDSALVLTRLVYQEDDLLSSEDGGRDLMREIDDHLFFGDGDGRLTLFELQAGVNDLPPPAYYRDGRTPLVVEVTFQPEPGETHKGQILETEFIFRLGDIADADLN